MEVSTMKCMWPLDEDHEFKFGLSISPFLVQKQEESQGII